MIFRKRSGILTEAQVNVPAGNKRKKGDGEISDGPLGVKRARRELSLLDALFDLPMELSQEIFSHLEPLDLLHLARTSKQLRRFFLDRSTRIPIWQRSFSNFVPPLPECPPDLAEPSYAELAFGYSCYKCGSTEGDLRTIWGLRIRICEVCRDVCFHFVDSVLRPYGLKLFSLLPGTSKTRYKGVQTICVYKPLDLALFEEFGESSDKEKWVADKIKEWEPIYEHARRCCVWVGELEARYHEDRLKAIEKNKAMVVERVKALGWEEELSLLSNEHQRVENLSVVVEACNNQLTEQVLFRLAGYAVKHLTKIRTSRLKAERRLVLRPRLVVLKAFHKTCVKSLPVNAIHPTASELFRLPAVRKIINDVPATVPFTQKHLAPIREDFDNIIRDWRADIELKLLELLSPGLSEIKDELKVWNIFGLATSVFYCSYPGCSRFLRYPEVMMHACATKPHHEDGAEIDIQIMNDSLHQTFWNYNRCITVNTEHVALLCGLLKKVGMDPLTATGRDLVQLNPLYECKPCYRSATGRAMMTWGQALVHCFNPQGPHNGDQSHDFVSLPWKIMLYVQSQMAKEEFLRRRNDRSPDYNFVCALCKEEGNFTDVLEHTIQVHENVDECEEDVVYRIDADRTLPVYRLLPSKEAEFMIMD